MSELRNKIESAKREYLAVKYPGDLALEVSRPRRNIFIRLAPIAALAAAAVIAIAISFRDVNQKMLAIATSQPAVLTEPTTQSASSESLLDSLDDLSGMSVVPPAYSFDISLPSFSLSGDQTNNKSSSTTQEST